MEIFFINEHNINQFRKRSFPQVMALGYFDGLHIGHREVIKTAINQAKGRNLPVAVMSFSPHPKVVLSNGKKQVQQLMTLNTKCVKLEEMGVDILYLVKFTKSFAQLSPMQFILDYVQGLGVNHVVAGFDFTFGYLGQGKLSNMSHYTQKQISVTQIEKIDFLDEKISSTAIRNRLNEGVVADLPHLLGHHYSIEAYWNGSEVQQFPCMAPAAGYYRVRVTRNDYQIETNVIVTVNRQVVFSTRLSDGWIGAITIEWLYNLEEMPFEKAQY